MMKLILLFLFLLCYPASEKRVYICESNSAYAYHTFEDCEGLAKCTHRLIETSMDSAIRVFRKDKLCGYCKYKAKE